MQTKNCEFRTKIMAGQIRKNGNLSLDFVKSLFVGFASLLLLKNQTSIHTNSDAATHEDKLFAFTYKVFDCLLLF